MRTSFVNLAKTLCVGLVSTTGALVAPAAAHAQTSVPCDTAALAAAITAANAATGPVTLDLAPGCTYGLTSALPDILGDLTIHGRHSTITRTVTQSFRILTVRKSLRLCDATISNGDADGDFGGGIANFGTLVVTDSRIRDNRGNFSGGIGGVAGTTTTITDSMITGNHAVHNGGGVANDGDMTVSRSRIIGNSADQLGGGIANDGTLRIDDSNVNENQAGTGGGGLATFGNVTVTVVRSNINNNRSAVAPGGVYNDGSSVTLTRSRVNGNTPTNCVGSPTTVAGCTG
ncbi:hypothetical protein ACFC1R_06210 [Kitasatospora sp. NPDC056138]|uniref:hypothetical protein n=1 Tax=Kitasatospora sp. NPDC056138 TaxID=3345724 RepID=UPI0035D731B0